MTRRISPETACIALWAGLFWTLIVTGRTSAYLSSRTAWVVPLGAIGLTIAAVGRAMVDGRELQPLTRLRMLRVVAASLPAVMILSLPVPSLGTFAASRRATALGAGVAASLAGSSEEVDMFDVSAAADSPEVRSLLAAQEGTEVVFEGFVTDITTDGFILNRFTMWCCVADALALRVPVIGEPDGLEPGQWVRLNGALTARSQDIAVAAERVVPIVEPDDPYLSS